VAYDLEQLGPIGFQDLAAALAVKTFGPGVQVMGAGRDGGRDLYHRGPLVWAPERGGETWDGYTVFQVKHKERLAARPQENAAWLWGQIRAELDEWADPAGSRDEVPQFLVFITNVLLSPVPRSGGHDQLNRQIKEYLAALRDARHDLGDGARRKARLARLSRLQAWRFWDGNQLQTLLDLHPGVRRAFPGFFTAADLFAGLVELADALPVDQLAPGLRAHARTTLIGESQVYFDEAGSGDVAGIPCTRSPSTCRSRGARPPSAPPSSRTCSTAASTFSGRR
jgi:hypothetical protein